MPWNGCLNKPQKLFLTVGDIGGPRSVYQRSHVPGRALFWAALLASHFILTDRVERGSKLSYKGKNPVLMSLSGPNYLAKTLPLYTLILN